VVGARNMIKALLIALLEPTGKLKDAERKMDFTERLALFEEQKSLPWAAVWDAYCVRQGVPVGMAWFDEVRQYEKAVLSTRLP
jgi:L-rhamnose isomerase